uniref:F-box domain-containing protein n=1 Tax=Ursus maritimus TaxID=29073 RepID=A0A452UBY7_URSMA
MWHTVRPLRAMHITQLNRECLLHLFSFLDKDSRKNLASTCPQLQDVFEDPALWPLLHFRPALRSLSICWYSSHVQVCSVEDWLKSALQRSICSRHESLVNDFLLRVCGCWRVGKSKWQAQDASILGSRTPGPSRTIRARSQHSPPRRHTVMGGGGASSS